MHGLLCHAKCASNGTQRTRGKERCNDGSAVVSNQLGQAPLAVGVFREQQELLVIRKVGELVVRDGFRGAGVIGGEKASRVSSVIPAPVRRSWTIAASEGDRYHRALKVESRTSDVVMH